MRFHTVKRGVLAGGAAILIAGSSLGVALAQQAPPAPQGYGTLAQDGGATQGPNLQKFLDTLAQKLGITTDRLTRAISDTRTELGMPANGGFPGFGGRPHGPGGPGRGVDLSAAAQAIGISVDTLRSELPGTTLAQVAQNHGKNPADVATALKNAANQHIDQEVSAGRMPADQAAQRKTEAAQRIDQMMTQVVPQRGAGGPEGFPGRGPRGGQGGQHPSASPAPSGSSSNSGA